MQSELPVPDGNFKELSNQQPKQQPQISNLGLAELFPFAIQLQPGILVVAASAWVSARLATGIFGREVSEHSPCSSPGVASAGEPWSSGCALNC